jgi:hypothetical protein
MVALIALIYLAMNGASSSQIRSRPEARRSWMC